MTMAWCVVRAGSILIPLIALVSQVEAEGANFAAVEFFIKKG